MFARLGIHVLCLAPSLQEPSMLPKPPPSRILSMDVRITQPTTCPSAHRFRSERGIRTHRFHSSFHRSNFSFSSSSMFGFQTRSNIRRTAIKMAKTPTMMAISASLILNVCAGSLVGEVGVDWVE